MTDPTYNTRNVFHATRPIVTDIQAYHSNMTTHSLQSIVLGYIIIITVSSDLVVGIAVAEESNFACLQLGLIINMVLCPNSSFVRSNHGSMATCVSSNLHASNGDVKL